MTTSNTSPVPVSASPERWYVVQTLDELSNQIDQLAEQYADIPLDQLSDPVFWQDIADSLKQIVRSRRIKLVHSGNTNCARVLRALEYVALDCAIKQFASDYGGGTPQDTVVWEHLKTYIREWGEFVNF